MTYRQDASLSSACRAVCVMINLCTVFTTNYPHKMGFITSVTENNAVIEEQIDLLVPTSCFTLCSVLLTHQGSLQPPR